MAAKKKTENRAILIRKVPAKVKAGFKAACARKNVTMQEALIQMMKEVNAGRFWI